MNLLKSSSLREIENESALERKSIKIKIKNSKEKKRKKNKKKKIQKNCKKNYQKVKYIPYNI